MSHPAEAPQNEPASLPRFPAVRARFGRRVVTRQVLKYRVRELCGQGFGFRYYAPRVAAVAAVTSLLFGTAIVAYAVHARSMSGESALYPLRRSLEDATPFGVDGASAEGQLWRAERRLEEARQTPGLPARRAILRDFERGLDATDARLAQLDADGQIRIRMRARSLESEAVLLVRSWPETLEPASPAATPTSTWVVDAAHDVPALMELEHEVEIGSAVSGDPAASMTLEELLKADRAFGAGLAPILVRLRTMVHEGNPYLSAQDIERYARFLLTD